MKALRFLCLLNLFAVVSFAQTGFIAGTVTDSNTRQGLSGANIIVENTLLGAAADLNGQFIIRNVPVGKYSVAATMMGYTRMKITDVKVKAGDTTVVHFALKQSVLEAGEAVTVSAIPKANMAYSLSSISADRIVTIIPSNDSSPQDWNTEEYSKINETDFLDVIKNPLSTFAADVDAAAYSNARRFIMQNTLPMKDAIRTEEFVNYFDYDYPEPEGDHPISITLEYGECPWQKKNNLVLIGLQGKRLKDNELHPSNLVFLLDVSGSMDSPEKLPLLKKAFEMLVDGLRADDRVSIVVYAGASGLVLPSTPGSDKETIKAALDKLEAGGSTAGGAGLKLAYEVAKQNFIKDGNNRVILATDGDFNIGISSTSELVRFIEEKRDEGIFLTVLGFGMGNYKDDRLQELADRGNGNHAYIDNIKEARKVFVHDLNATLFTIAKDVKIQVEFNPAHIQSYRLIGYENRRLKNEDFEDDKKDAGEMGSGHSVTALYEVIPAQPNQKPPVQDLKYQVSAIKKSALESDEILTVSIRYKEPEGDKSQEFSKILSGDPNDLKKTSENFRFAAAAAEFALLLFDSQYKGDASTKQILELAKGASINDPFGYRAEFLDMVDRASLLMDKK